MKDDNDKISCTKIIPFSGMLSPSPLLGSIHKSGKLELPELKEHRNSLDNLISRLGIPSIHNELLKNPKLDAKILSEIASNFFSSSYSPKANDLVRTMSMPNFHFDNIKETTVPNIDPQPVKNELQQSIINEIKEMASSQPKASEENKENNQSQNFDNFF